MTDEWTMARHDYAAQVGLQSLRTLIAAAHTSDARMRAELSDTAGRLSRHAVWLGHIARGTAAEPR